MLLRFIPRYQLVVIVWIAKVEFSTKANFSLESDNAPFVEARVRENQQTILLRLDIHYQFWYKILLFLRQSLFLLFVFLEQGSLATIVAVLQVHQHRVGRAYGFAFNGVRVRSVRVLVHATTSRILQKSKPRHGEERESQPPECPF